MMSEEKMNSKCSDYLEGRLTPEEMKEFDQHLAKDPALAEVFYDLKTLIESEKILKGLNWRTPQGFETRLFSKIAEEKEPNSTSVFRIVGELLRFIGAPTPVRVGIIATLFLISFSVLLTQKVGTTLPPSTILEERRESRKYESVEQPSQPPGTALTEAHSTYPEIASAPAETVLEQKSELTGAIDPKPQTVPQEKLREPLQRKKAKLVPQSVERGLPQMANSLAVESDSTFGTSSDDAPPAESITGADGPATFAKRLYNDLPTGTDENGLVPKGAGSRAVPQNTLRSRESSSIANRECQSEHEIVHLDAAQQIFELPLQDSKVTHTTSKPVKAVICLKDGSWIGLRFLEGELCPWASRVKESAGCPIGWVRVKTPD
jgi:hypothetical protein